MPRVSRIVRELVAEAQAARAKAAEAKAPKPVLIGVDPAAEAGDWSYVYGGTGGYLTGICVHGRELADPCHECGRR